MATSLDSDSLLRQLTAAAAPELAPLYVVTGDEILLATETADALRAAAAKAGYSERVSLIMDARSDWSALIGATQNVSLFGDLRLVDVSIPTGKPGRNGADTLVKLAEMIKTGALAGTMVLINLPRLDRATRNAKWAQALIQAAVMVDIASIGRNELPNWIARRLAAQGQQLERPSLEWMADKVEGNLLAAHQEIQKLGLLYPEGKISADDVELAVLNVARYNVFGLRDAMLGGQPSKTLAMLTGLRAEGEALPLILWAIGDEVRVLARLSAAQEAGQDMQAEMRRQRVFGQREQLLRQTLRRVSPRTWPAAVQHAHDIDRLIKGLRVPGRLDDPWEELSRLALRIAVSPAPRPR